MHENKQKLGFAYYFAATTALLIMTCAQAEAGNRDVVPAPGKAGTYLCPTSATTAIVRSIPLGQSVPKGCQLTGKYWLERNLAEKAPHYKGWTSVNVGGVYWLYIELGSMKRSNNISNYWLLDEYSGDIPNGDFLHAKSIKTQNIMNCDSHMTQVQSVVGYSGKGAMGQVTFRRGAGPLYREQGEREIIERVVCTNK